MNTSSAEKKLPIILLVEDNASHAELVVRSLQRNEIVSDIRHLSDGEQALDYLFRHGDFVAPETSPRPQVVLLDLRLPKIDGLEVLKRIKDSQHLRRTPVVVFTTSNADEDVLNAYAYHANSVLGKPTDFSVFNRLLQDTVNYWLNWNQSPWMEAVV